MKRLDIIIPTRNRLQKLIRTIETIPDAAGEIPINIIIVSDGDSETAAFLVRNHPRIGRMTYVRKHQGAVYCRNLATAAAEDAVLYATDDVTFHPGAIEAAVRFFGEKFKDDDGVVGFNQVNHAHFSRAGVAIVGQTFLRRYPNRLLFYPKYFHFACQEIARAGDILGKIHLCEEANLTHHHPMLDHENSDTTHVEARKWRARDKEISSSRAAAGLTWGIGKESAE